MFSTRSGVCEPIRATTPTPMRTARARDRCRCRFAGRQRCVCAAQAAFCTSACSPSSLHTPPQSRFVWPFNLSSGPQLAFTHHRLRRRNSTQAHAQQAPANQCAKNTTTHLSTHLSPHSLMKKCSLIQPTAPVAPQLSTNKQHAKQNGYKHAKRKQVCSPVDAADATTRRRTSPLTRQLQPPRADRKEARRRPAPNARQHRARARRERGAPRRRLPATRNCRPRRPGHKRSAGATQWRPRRLNPTTKPARGRSSLTAPGRGGAAGDLGGSGLSEGERPKSPTKVSRVARPCRKGGAAALEKARIQGSRAGKAKPARPSVMRRRRPRSAAAGQGDVPKGEGGRGGGHHPAGRRGGGPGVGLALRSKKRP